MNSTSAKRSRRSRAKCSRGITATKDRPTHPTYRNSGTTPMHKRFIMARLHFKSLLACFPHSLPPGRLQLSLQIIGKTNTRCLSHNMRKVLDTISRSSWLAHQEFLPVICHQMKQDILVLQGHSPLRQTLAQRQVSPNPISHEARRQMLAKW